METPLYYFRSTFLEHILIDLSKSHSFYLREEGMSSFSVDKGGREVFPPFWKRDVSTSRFLGLMSESGRPYVYVEMSPTYSERIERPKNIRYLKRFQDPE